jgi:hypothetical protein
MKPSMELVAAAAAAGLAAGVAATIAFSRPSKKDSVKDVDEAEHRTGIADTKTLAFEYYTVPEHVTVHEVRDSNTLDKLAAKMLAAIDREVATSGVAVVGLDTEWGTADGQPKECVTIFADILSRSLSGYLEPFSNTTSAAGAALNFLFIGIVSVSFPFLP